MCVCVYVCALKHISLDEIPLELKAQLNYRIKNIFMFFTIVLYWLWTL